jgi:DNA-directed RNA polymerase subunit beta'
MAESIYDRINDYGSVKISLASANDIRSWSFGEVRKPETINYRTYRPEKDGLFCERIFGPERDWECACGKYKGTKFKGIICDRCGVKVTHSRVRRKRMGHINLAAPVVHIWFFKAMPSRLSSLLGMKTSAMEKVIYFQDYVVTDAGQSPLKVKQLITEDEYREACNKYGSCFRASMGAEAIKELLGGMGLDELSAELRAAMNATSSRQKIKDLTKRLKIVNSVRSSDNKPEWMILDVVPVIPPDLRPLVMLESGNFATSDLNDLYRRIINRNNRLKKLIDLNAPEVIIRNEKRMLQQAVDSLLDNGRCRRPVLGSNNRPLKSLTDMIRGKQGRFRENLLGKRVDYSARSVIVVGPNLRLHQCGLPKKIALELYQPFIIRKLKDRGLADTIKSAKRMLERREEQVWDILEEVIHQHPVLLNRAPTLHRMGIQAFEPVLVEGNAIMLHPLVCQGFNADFDGDQMAVHLPLSIEAQVEAHTLLLSTNSIFSPQSGSPMLGPSQDIVLGNYYITCMRLEEKGEGMLFRDTFEAITACEMGKVDIHARVKVCFPADKKIMGESGQEKGGVIETTPGRCLFNDILSDKMPFYNFVMDKRKLGMVIQDCFEVAGGAATIELLDKVKDIGFKQVTLAGLSFGIIDLRIPDEKQSIIEKTQKKVDRVQKNYDAGVLTEGERYNQIIDAWTHARVEVTNAMMNGMQDDVRDGKPYLNPIWVMKDSGARGSVDQIQQLAGMRALMAKPSGEVIETPIRSNFREGLNVLEYFSSTHGARKGLADTALKTADSGYLTRKLADVAQNVMITQIDCGTLQGITKSTVYKGEAVDVPLKQLITGRTARDNVRNPITGEMIVLENEVITFEAADKIEALGLDSIRVRSPLTCESEMGMCAKCYGWDLSTGRLVEEGLAVGIIAAQSIGEPGTQLTMRTFHTGGIAEVAILETDLKTPRDGIIKYRDLNVVPDPDVWEESNGKAYSKDLVSTSKDPKTKRLVESKGIVLGRNGEVLLLDQKGRELEKFKVPYGAIMQVKGGTKAKKGQRLFSWDPHRVPILAEVSGFVRLVDVIEGETMRVEEERRGQLDRPVVIEHKGDKHPQVIIEDSEGKILDVHYLPAKARIEVDEGEEVAAGKLLARLPRGSEGTQDITGGLPRVTEIFEARKPKEPAAMAEISGDVELKSDKRRGKMTITVRSEGGMEKEHHVPRDRHLNCHTGDVVEAGDTLTEGPLVPHDILRIKGEEALQRYLLREIQNVYRAQSVVISDKHIEIIIAQMMRKVEIESIGDSMFLPGEVVGKFSFRRANEELGRKIRVTDAGDSEFVVEQVISKEEFENANESIESLGGTPAKGKKPRPATANALLLGITKASLQSDSFISAASFQETTKVLTEASLAGRVDQLRGLKENVILGHLIPAGTAFKPHFDIKVKHLAEPPVPKVLEELRDAKEAEAAAEKAVKEALGIS